MAIRQLHTIGFQATIERQQVLTVWLDVLKQWVAQMSRQRFAARKL
jgi:hypothetical protein